MSRSNKFNDLIDKKTHYEIILTDKYGLEKGRAKFDKEYLDIIRARGRWSLDKYGYVIKSNPYLAMHRLIMQPTDDQEVDHKKVGIKYRSDNRKQNLRVATHSQNMINKKIHPNNTSGYKGVSWDKSRNKWLVKITIDKKQTNLGRFDLLEDAVKVYTKAAKKLHGDWRQNLC